VLSHTVHAYKYIVEMTPFKRKTHAVRPIHPGNTYTEDFVLRSTV
jgi:hypothetical protein